MKLSEGFKHVIHFLNSFRKMVMMLIILVVSTYLVLHEYIDGDNWATVASTVGAAYMAFEDIKTMADAVKDWLMAKIEGEKSESKRKPK